MRVLQTSVATVALGIAVSACGSSAEVLGPEEAPASATPTASATETSTPSPSAASEASEIEEETGLIKAGPKFRAHFTDPIYFDPSDELAPFGSDAGWDLVAAWTERRDELTSTSTVADIAEGDLDDLLADGSDFDSALHVYVSAFALLRLTDQIDPAGKEAALTAIDALQGAGGFPEPTLIFAREDLESWSS